MKFPQILKWWEPKSPPEPEPIYVDKAAYDAAMKAAVIKASNIELERQIEPYFPGLTVLMHTDEPTVVTISMTLRPIEGREVIWR